MDRSSRAASRRAIGDNAALANAQALAAHAFSKQTSLSLPSSLLIPPKDNRFSTLARSLPILIEHDARPPGNAR